jgi:uncharacterized membrane protein YedE/YeeE
MIRQALVALLAGTLFGAGLAVSGMADPARVRAFLDVFGGWDPTLAFVMAGALLPMAAAWRIQARIQTPLAAAKFELPTTRGIDGKLLGGAAIFGIGWGIAGLCPGPAIADLALRPVLATPFVLAMLAALIQRISGIRWRMSLKRLILLKDWVSRPFHSPDQTERHPPCSTLRPRRSAFQPSGGRKSLRLSMVGA